MCVVGVPDSEFSGWFVGEMARAPAEALLEKCDFDAFIIRMSTSQGKREQRGGEKRKRLEETQSLVILMSHLFYLSRSLRLPCNF